MKKLFKMMALVAFMASAGIVSAADSDKAAAKSSTMKVPKPASSVGGAGYAEAVITMPVPSDIQSSNPNGLTSNQNNLNNSVSIPVGLFGVPFGQSNLWNISGLCIPGAANTDATGLGSDTLLNNYQQSSCPSGSGLYILSATMIESGGWRGQ